MGLEVLYFIAQGGRLACANFLDSRQVDRGYTYHWTWGLSGLFFSAAGLVSSGGACVLAEVVAIVSVCPLVEASGGGSFVAVSPRQAVSWELGRPDRPRANRSTVELVLMPDLEPYRRGGKLLGDSLS